MVVMPVSGVSVHKNNYNNYLAFEGRGKFERGKSEVEKSTREVPRTTSPLLKSVPVAVVLSMMPMTAPVQAGNTKVFNENQIEYVVPAKTETAKVYDMSATDSNKKGYVVDEKEFLFYANGKTYITAGFMELISSTKRGKTIDGIDMILRTFGDDDIEGRIVELTDVALNLQGDDGVIGATIKYKQLLVQDDKTGRKHALSRPDMIEYVENILNSDKNNTGIKINKVTKNITPDGKFGWETVSADTSWLNRDSGVSYGKAYLQSNPIKGTNGTYYLRAYSSTEEEGDPYDAMVIIKDNSKEMKLVSVNKVTTPLVVAEELGNIMSDQIVVSKGDAGNFVLLDKELARILYSLKNDPMYKNTFTTSEEKVYLAMTPDVRALSFTMDEE